VLPVRNGRTRKRVFCLRKQRMVCCRCHHARQRPFSRT
jgi:hypothetical protein